MNLQASAAMEPDRQPFQITRQLAFLEANAPISRRVFHAGEHIYHAVDAFDRLYVVGAGLCKTIEVSRDGREQVVAVHFNGDWMGLGGIAAGRYGVCIDCGTAIDFKRLEAYPTAKRCIACQQRRERTRAPSPYTGR